MKSLLETIERELPEGGDWCTLEKAQTLAAMVIAMRPKRVVEIGVWMGGSALPMALALKHVEDLEAAASAGSTGARSTAEGQCGGELIAIDPWSPSASASGETEKNAAWWSSVDHEAAFRAFCGRLDRHDLRNMRPGTPSGRPLVVIERKKSDDAVPPMPIDLLHIDGNHRAQARRDVERFACNVRLGGIAILDDLGWDGGYVDQGVELARTMGFADLYRLDKGLVMQRLFIPGWGRA